MIYENNNGTLTNLEMYKEDGEYYLQATYHCIYRNGCECDWLIEKIHLPIKENLNCVYVSNNEEYNFFGEEKNLRLGDAMTVDLGFGKLNVEENSSGDLFRTMNYSGVEEDTAKQLEELVGHKVMGHYCE